MEQYLPLASVETKLQFLFREVFSVFLVAPLCMWMGRLMPSMHNRRWRNSVKGIIRFWLQRFYARKSTIFRIIQKKFQLKQYPQIFKLHSSSWLRGNSLDSWYGNMSQHAWVFLGFYEHKRFEPQNWCWTIEYTKQGTVCWGLTYLLTVFSILNKRLSTWIYTWLVWSIGQNLLCSEMEADLILHYLFNNSNKKNNNNNHSNNNTNIIANNDCDVLTDNCDSSDFLYGRHYDTSCLQNKNNLLLWL